MESEGIIVFVLWFGGIFLMFGAMCFGIWFTVFRRVGEALPGLETRAKDSPFRPIDLTQTINAFVIEWEATFKLDNFVDLVLDGADIIFIEGDGPKRSFPISDRGKRINVAGVADNARRLRVAWVAGDSIGGTALFHELVHFVLWNLNGEPDPDHEEGKYKGWTKAHSEMVGRLKKRFLSLKTVSSPSLALAVHKAAQPLTVLFLGEENVHCGTCSRSEERVETLDEEKRRKRREEKTAKQMTNAGQKVWNSSRAGTLNKESFDPDKQKDANEDRYRADLISDLEICLRQTVSVACTELAKESWREVLRWQKIGEAVLDVMATVDNDPVQWRKVVGSPDEYKSELNRLSFGFAALAFRAEGVTIPMLNNMQFSVNVPHPKAPLS